MSKTPGKVLDRRAEEARRKRFADVTRVARFQPDDSVHSLDVEAFLASAAPAITELLAPAWESEALDLHALLVSDQWPDRGSGSVNWLSLATAFKVAARLSSVTEARALLVSAPSKSIRLVVRLKGRIAIRVYSREDLRRALADAKRMAMHLVVEQPSEALFESLVDRDPQRLLQMLSDSKMDPTLLTFAAEVAGRIPGSDTVTALLKLTTHEKSYVREGAVLGLALHPDDRNAVEALDRLTNDPSPGVQMAARSQACASRAGP